MKADELKSLVELTRDLRTPCERDGHNYYLITGGNGDVIYCTKCGHTERLHLPPPANVGFQT